MFVGLVPMNKKAVVVKPDTKICRTCKIPKEIKFFCKRSNNQDGRSNECNECVRDRSMQYRQKSKEARNFFL